MPIFGAAADRGQPRLLQNRSLAGREALELALLVQKDAVQKMVLDCCDLITRDLTHYAEY